MSEGAPIRCPRRAPSRAAVLAFPVSFAFLPGPVLTGATVLGIPRHGTSPLARPLTYRNCGLTSPACMITIW